MNNVAVLEDYVTHYKDTFYAGLARARLEELKREEERQRVALLQKEEEERKRAEDLAKCNGIA
jgi:hypothetical protein